MPLAPPPTDDPLPSDVVWPDPTPPTPAVDPVPGPVPRAVEPGPVVPAALGPPSPRPSEPPEDKRSAPLTVVPQPARATAANAAATALHDRVTRHLPCGGTASAGLPREVRRLRARDLPRRPQMSR